ncbi:MAG TPA: ATP-grasp domain-containing protein [Acidobacteriota bacterium]|nr:ATP-grasp domain-containing protein [Acidobacteriota bacterium]
MNQKKKPRVLLFHCERFAFSKLQQEDLFDITLVVKSEAAKDRVDTSYTRNVHIVDHMDSEGLVALGRQLHAEAPLDAVFALRDEPALPAAQICRELGIAGVSGEAVATVDSKARLRKLLNSRGIGSVRFQVVPQPVKDVSALVEAIGLPLICKPHNSSGSILVRKCNTREELEDYLDEYPFEAPLLVEEFLEGREYSVESFTRDGRHHVVAITEKFTTGAPNFVETGHIVPAALSEQERDQIVGVVLQLLEALELDLGPTHTEVMLTATGPRIIESHIRPGGDGIEQLVDEAYDFVMTTETLKGLTGLPMKMPLSRARCHVTSQFFGFPSGTLKRAEGFEEMSKKEGVKVFQFPYSPGDHMRLVRSSHTRHGYFGCVADSRQDLDRLINEIRAGCRVEVEVEE